MKSGNGISDVGKSTIGVTECPSCGSILEVKNKKGKGLYLKPYSGYSTGSGLVRLIGNPSIAKVL